MKNLPSTRTLSVTFSCALAVSACLSKSSGTASGPQTTSPPPGSTPPAAGSTGAFGIVTVDGKQKMYLPAGANGPNGNGFIAVVDAGVAGKGVAGAPALLTTIDLGGIEVATATGGDSSTVVAVSTVSPKVWFIDPKTDTLVGMLALDGSYGQSGFSGGGGYVTGVAVDSTNHRAILSTWNGFAIVDLPSRSITRVIQAPPAENFGFDSVHERIIAPFYACAQSTSTDGGLSFCGDYKAPDGTPMTDGLNVIDLSDGTVYTYQASANDSGVTRTPSEPLGGEPDSAAIDPTTQIAVVPSESEGSQNVLDLSKAVFDKAGKSFTAPLAVVQGQSLEGVAIEPSSHLGFFEAEHSSDVGVIDVTQASTGGGTFVHAQMPNTPDGSGWSNMGDPHGVAVTTGLADGHAIGFVVSSDQHWVARIDLAKMAAAGAAFDASAGFPDISSAVTYLDATSAVGGDGGAAPSGDAGTD